MGNMSSVSFRKEMKKKEEKNMFTLIIKMQILFASPVGIFFGLFHGLVCEY